MFQPFQIPLVANEHKLLQSPSELQVSFPLPEGRIHDSTALCPRWSLQSYNIYCSDRDGAHNSVTELKQSNVRTKSTRTLTFPHGGVLEKFSNARQASSRSYAALEAIFQSSKICFLDQQIDHTSMAHTTKLFNNYTAGSTYQTASTILSYSLCIQIKLPKYAQHQTSYLLINLQALPQRNIFQ